jgi:hypothetical protein
MVRTAFSPSPLNLSEVCSSSDSFSSSTTKPVRSWLGFGQLFLFHHQSCTKLALVRTAFPLPPLNLSEVGSGSDSFSSSTTKPVRSWLWFGQLFLFQDQTCPKVALVRTAFPLPPLNLSEVGSGSDSFSSSTTKPVRSWLWFGQLFLFHHQTCPKLALVRTAFPLPRPNLSEAGSSSDSFSSSTTKPVQSWLWFGQLFFFQHQTCPKLALVRTAFPLSLPNLSEVGSGSDSFSSSTTKPVRSWLWFGQLFLFHHQTCPKLALVRTAFPLPRPNLSEAGSSSDSFSSFNT